MNALPPVRVVFADEHLVVADKPAGLLAVPGRGEAGQHNLVAQLARRWPGLRVVHRLDQATSGLLVLALSAEAQRALSMAFEARAVHKQYRAVVTGVPEAGEGVITAPLIVDWPNRPRQMIDAQAGKPSLTRWWRLQANATHSLLRLEPVTGRSHQLRVHLLSLGHAIVGDTLYHPDPVEAAAPRMLLHAAVLALAHPASGEPLRFESAAPFGLAEGSGYSADSPPV